MWRRSGGGVEPVGIGLCARRDITLSSGGRNFSNPPGSCMVHAVQGRTVEGRLVIHQTRHPHADMYWLYTAVSREIGRSLPSLSIFVVERRAQPSKVASAAWTGRGHEAILGFSRGFELQRGPNASFKRWRGVNRKYAP